MWQKTENHEWLCLRLKHSYLLLCHHVVPEKTSAFVTWEQKKGMIFTDSPLLSEGLRLPELGWSREPKGSPSPGWADLGAPPPAAACRKTQLRPKCVLKTWCCGRRGWRPPPGQHLGGSSALWHNLFLLGECWPNIFPNKLDVWVMTNLP